MMDKFCGLFNFTDSLLELAHSQTFFFRPYSLVWHDLRALLITPASNTIAFTTAKLNSRFINHEFNQAKIEYPMILLHSLVRRILYVIENIRYYWIVSLGYLKNI
jgi:hypothetical protein